MLGGILMTNSFTDSDHKRYALTKASANRDTSEVYNAVALIGTYADKRNAIVNLIQIELLDDNDLIKYQAVCDTYEKVIRDLVRIFNAESDNVRLNVESLLSFVKLGG